jgi:peptidoglycan/LPS O-acetylase OafA/YrhL
MYIFRAFAVWLIIIFAESIHGTIRQLFLAPLVGDFPARRIAVFTGMILIFLITYFFILWINAPSVKSLFAVGLMWVVLTVVFEFGLGIFVFGYSSERIFDDYDLTRGGLMGFGLLFMLLAPLFASKFRDFKESKGNQVE